MTPLDFTNISKHVNIIIEARVTLRLGVFKSGYADFRVPIVRVPINKNHYKSAHDSVRISGTLKYRYLDKSMSGT